MALFTRHMLGRPWARGFGGGGQRWLMTREVVFPEVGQPTSVLRVEDRELGPLKSGQIRIQFLGAPINPADLNQVTGVYPVKARFRETPRTAVGGNEGVGEIVDAGESGLQVGTWVTIRSAGFGTWRSVADVVAEDIAPLPHPIPLEMAATLTVNPATALCMIQNFVKPKEGSWIIQNGGNSGVGQAVIQVARNLGMRTINVIRDRDNFDEVAGQLKGLGADVVLREGEGDDPGVRAKYMPEERPQLALNCVGGRSMASLTKWLGTGGTMVTYGGMSRKPAALSISSLIFQDVAYRGFWMTRWYEKASGAERAELMRRLCEWGVEGKLVAPPMERVEMGKAGDGKTAEVTEALHEAIRRMEGGFSGKKPLLLFA